MTTNTTRPTDENEPAVRRRRWLRHTALLFVVAVFVASFWYSIRLLDARLVDAAASGDLDGVKQCLTLGRDPNRAVRGRLPLVVASRKGHTMVVEHLIAAKARVDGCIDVHGAPTSLIAAVEEGHVAVVAILVKAGANLRYTVAEGVGPLAIAARRGDLPVVKALVGAGAPVAAVDTWQRTALDWARLARRINVVRYLAAKGAAGEAEGAR